MIYWFDRNSKKIYDNKIDALKDSCDIDLKINEDYGYYDYDWTVEPQEDWKTLLKQHAQYLRDTNEKIRIWYSGGRDSQTVLDAFLENNIFIDEIATWRGTPTEDFENALATSEVNRVAIPFLKSIQHKIPSTRINLYDVGYKSYHRHIDKYFKYSQDFLAALSVYNQPLYKPELFTVDDEYMNITGLDKPRVYCDEFGYYFELNDNMFLHDTKIPGKSFKNCNHFFYSSREIYAKQCHIVMNQMKNNSTNKETLSISDITNKFCRSNLFIDYSAKKSSGHYFLSEKAFADYQDCKNHSDSEKRQLAELYEKRFNDIDLPLKYFHNNKKFDGLIGIITKKFRLE